MIIGKPLIAVDEGGRSNGNADGASDLRNQVRELVRLLEAARRDGVESRAAVTGFSAAWAEESARRVAESGRTQSELAKLASQLAVLDPRISVAATKIETIEKGASVLAQSLVAIRAENNTQAAAVTALFRDEISGAVAVWRMAVSDLAAQAGAATAEFRAELTRQNAAHAEGLNALSRRVEEVDTFVNRAVRGISLEIGVCSRNYGELSGTIAGLRVVGADLATQVAAAHAQMDTMRIEHAAQADWLEKLEIAQGELSKESDIRRNDTDAAATSIHAKLDELSESFNGLGASVGGLRHEMRDLQVRLETPWWRRLVNWWMRGKRVD